MSKPPARSRPVLSAATITAFTAFTATAAIASAAAIAVPAQATALPARAAKAPAQTPAKTPAPAILNAISCVSAKDCVAVGATNPNGNSNLIAERWNGTRWHRLSVPEPGGVINKALTAVDCPAAHMCLAVGADDNAKSRMGAAVGAVWNGVRWSASDPPNWGDPLTTTTAINSVSCGSPTACAAAGVFQAADSPARSATTGSATTGRVTTGGATEAPIAEFWGPGATAHIPVTEPGWTAAYFDGVSCEAADRCVAVGGYEKSRRTYTLVETLTGGKWRFDTSARPVRGRLKAVSCATATTCVAVGQDAANGGKPLVERSADGLRAWTRTSALLPRHVSWASLDTVSCASRAGCLAGGESGNGDTAFVDTVPATGTRVKVLVSSGKAWPVHIMNGISCWSATACAVLGSSIPYTGASRSPLTRSVTAFLSAGKWKIVKTP